MTATIPMNDLSRSASIEHDSLVAALSRVSDSGWYLRGAETAEFEREFARMVGVRHCVGVGNGTDALEIALRSLGVGPGARVATVANAGFYTSTACLAVGATPAYVDIDPRTLQMDGESLTLAIADGVDAVVLTHLFGNAEAAPSISEICLSSGIPLIEDCAQATGAIVAGRAAGSFGDLATFSFYPTKNLGALGDGGAVVTDRPDIADRVRAISQYGWTHRYRVAEPGRNSRLDELQAAVLRTRLLNLPADNTRRRQIVQQYASALEGSALRMAHRGKGPGCVAHLAVVVGDEVAALGEFLKQRGIQSDIHYPVLDHQQPVWDHLGVTWSPLPRTEAIVSRIRSIPCYPTLRDEEVDRVTEVLLEWVERRGSVRT